MNTQKRILFIAIAALVAVCSFGCSFSVTTAKIADAIMTDSIDANGMPGNTVTYYPSNADMLYTSAKILNAPDNTKIRIVWIYATDNDTFDEITLDSGDISDRYIYSSFEPSSALPEGDYEVQYFVGERTKPDATVKFRVTAAEAKETVDTTGAYVEDVHMTSGFDSEGVPLDTVDTVAPTGIWYVSAVLRNTQSDTIVHYVWYDTEDNIIDEYDFNPEGATDVYISGTMELTTIAPEGEYWVEIYLDDGSEPAAQISFTVSNVAAESTASLGDFTSHTMQDGGFKVNYPSSWESIEVKESNSVVFFPAEYTIDNESDVNAVIIVALKDYVSGYTLEDFQQAWIKNKEESGYDKYVNVSSTIDSVNGRDMAIYEYSYSRNGYDLYTMDFMTIEGADAYVITFTATMDELETLYPYVEQIVLSFDLL